MNRVLSALYPSWLALASFVTLVLATAWTPGSAAGQSIDKLVSQQEAARNGLRRAWFTQVQLDPQRHRVIQLTLDRELLFVLTDQATVHAFDATTGASKWVAQFGNPYFTSLGPAANDRFVAVINGSTLYLLDRATGTTLWQQSLDGGPGGGPALSQSYVFAPLINGVMKGIALDKIEESRTAWAYPSVGRAMVQPAVSGEHVFWPTDRGFLYVATANDPQMLFRLETQDEIIAKPAYRKPMIFVGSLDGYVYAVDEATGIQRWKYSAGDAIAVSPAAIEDQVFVCSQAPRMSCLSAEEGEELWRASNVERFVAASPERVYGMDRWSNLYILDRTNGTLLGRVSFRGSTMPLVNQQTDRLYLATPTGLIQCLHEIGVEEPIRYEPPPLPEKTDDSGQTQPTAPVEPAATEDPFAGLPSDDPFATADP